jgi:hypothetical protein
MKRSYRGQERRSAFRIMYEPHKRPVLKIRQEEFEVADISEKGLRILTEKRFDNDNGLIRFSARFGDGETVDMEGRVVWCKNNEFGLHLKTIIPASILHREGKNN